MLDESEQGVMQSLIKTDPIFLDRMIEACQHLDDSFAVLLNCCIEAETSSYVSATIGKLVDDFKFDDMLLFYGTGELPPQIEKRMMRHYAIATRYYFNFLDKMDLEIAFLGSRSDTLEFGLSFYVADIKKAKGEIAQSIKVLTKLKNRLSHPNPILFVYWNLYYKLFD